MRSLLFPLLVFISTVLSTQAFDFYVGCNEGWVLNPSESLNHWAGKNRFHVHDNLVFKYKKGQDTVLEVRKEDYFSCNTSNFVTRMGSGYSWFPLERTGAFFFISGNPDHCNKGQKMVVVVDEIGQAKSPQMAPSPSPLSKGLPSCSSPSSPAPSISHSPSPSSPPFISPSISHSPSRSSPPSITPTPSSEDASSPSNAPADSEAPMKSTQGPAPSPSLSSGSLKRMMVKPVVMLTGLVLSGLFT